LVVDETLVFDDAVVLRLSSLTLLSVSVLEFSLSRMERRLLPLSPMIGCLNYIEENVSHMK